MYAAASGEDGYRRGTATSVAAGPGSGKRYAAELADYGALLDLILDIEQHRGAVTLLYAARDEEHNEAVLLAEVLRDRPRHALHGSCRT